MTKAKIFSTLLISFLSGIFSASFYFPRIFPQEVLWLGLVVAIISVAVFWKARPIVLAGFCFLFFLLGIGKFDSKAGRLENFSQAQKFSGMTQVAKEPEKKNGKKQVVVKTESNFNILVLAGPYEKIDYKDKLQLDCDLEIPENQAESRFDYRMYLAKDGIFYICRKPKMEILETGRQKDFYGLLVRVKKAVSEKINQKIPAPESGLLEGLLLGGDAGLSKNLKEAFSRTGMSHIVAVSGYNVTIISEYLMLLGIFLGLWRRQAFWVAIGGIFLFVFLIGFPASAVRAALMGGLILFAMKNGRLANAGNAILFSAAIMLLWNPLLLRYDVGFELSFLATLGIVYIYPILEEYLVRKEKYLSAPSEILVLTLAAQVFVLPVILYNFGSLSLVSPLANLLILPIIPLTMLLGFLMIILSFVFPPLATVLAWLTFLPLRFETFLIEFLSHWHFASLSFSFPAWGVWAWYATLGALFFWLKRKRFLKKNLSNV